MKIKVVQTGDAYELIGWEKSDRMHYGIRDKSKGHIIETFEPTKKLKGWQMRKHVEAVLEKYEAEGIPEERKHKVSITKSVAEIQIGDVLVYENTLKGNELVYGLVIKITDAFIYIRYGNRGYDFQFEKEGLQDKIDRDVIWVIDSLDVPKEVTF